MTHDTSTKQFTIKRDGDRDLEFLGRILGTSSMKTDTGRGTDVGIFQTEGGKYIVSVHQWTQWENERDLHRAGVCDGPQAVLDWLLDDCGGNLGPASKEAIEAAAAWNEGLASVAVEKVG